MLSRTIRRALFGAALALTQSACMQEESALDTFVENHRVGTSADVWLEVHNAMGEWERLALVFGYFDDYSACRDIELALREKFRREYRCSVAN